MRLSRFFVILIGLLLSPAVHAQNAYVTSLHDGTVSVISISTRAVVATIATDVRGNPVCAIVTPDGSKVYICNGFGAVSVISTATNSVIATIDIGGGSSAAAISPDGRTLYVGSDPEHTIKVIDTTSNTVTRTLQVGGPVSIAVTPDGSKLYALVDKVLVISLATNAVIATVNVGSQLRAVAITPDGSKAYVSKNGNPDAVSVIATATNSVIATVSLANYGVASGLVVSPDGGKVYVSGSGSVSVIATASNTVAGNVPIDGTGIGELALTADGAQLYVPVYYKNKVSVVDTASNAVTTSVPVGQFPTAVGISTGSSSLVSAVLPSSRSIQIGTTATAFATILNAGGSTASGCGIAPLTALPASFTFQTTSSKTNGLTGSPNTRVSIPAGAAQSYVIAFSATGPLASTDVALKFSCTGASAATIVGVNTLKLVFSSTPAPDMIAVGLTASNDGYSHLTGFGQTGTFVIATSNIGVAGTLTARAVPINASTPVVTRVCETNPSTGICLATPTATVTRVVNQNETATWTAYIVASSAVATDAAANRVSFEFVDASGVVRGSTSIAVTTSP